ncbi:MAG: DUF4870 domain-containing protein [Elusimicrobiota bacterium]
MEEEKKEVQQTETKEKKTVMGVKENLEALLCYVLGWITGIVFILLEKDNEFVRFHAVQSIVVFGGLMIISIALNYIPFIGFIVSIFIAPVSFILWIFLMYKAFNGEKYKLPLAGDFAEDQLK